MANAKRISYSLLISTLAFAVFTVFAFSGLFPWIESQFYSPKVVSDLQGRIGVLQDSYRNWQDRTANKLALLTKDPVFEGVFSPNPAREKIQGRFQAAKLALNGFSGSSALRILNAGRNEVHFTTVDSDLRVSTDFKQTISRVSELKGLPDLANLPSTTKTDFQVLSDPTGAAVFFLAPFQDSVAGVPGYSLLSVSLEDWRLMLIQEGFSGAEQPIVSLSAEQFVFSSTGRPLDKAVVDRIKGLVAQGGLSGVQRLAQADGKASLSLITRGEFSLVVPSGVLELGLSLKIVLLISFFTVIFLVVFLIANVRGEPLSLVTRKVKQFQIQVVKQYFDLREPDKIQSLRDELARHSSEIQADVRKSLGRVRRQDRAFVDKYIDTSWQEVMDLFRGPAPPVEASSNADWKRLETLLQQALTQGRFVASGPEAPRPRPTTAPPVAFAARESVEELEEVEDLEDVEEAEELDEVEAAEPVEEAQELDDLEEVEELDDLEVLSELGEAAEAVDLESLDEPETEDAELLEELDSQEGEDDDVADLEEVQELEPLDQTQSVFLARSHAAAEGPVTTLTSLGDGGWDESEELDELEEVSEDEGVSQAQDFSYSLERLDAVWGATAVGVFDQSGDVISLSEEVFADTTPSNDAFGLLVDEVLAGPDSTGFLPLEKEDLLPQHQSREWRWTGGGFDWDRFALGSDEVNLFRALSEIVTELDAFTAAILTETEGRWTAQSSVGFSDSGKSVLDFDQNAPLTKGFLSVRALHILQGGGAHAVLRDSFHAKDTKFLKAVVCVPLLFRHEAAWLLLGLRRQPEDLLNLLAPRRVG